MVVGLVDHQEKLLDRRDQHFLVQLAFSLLGLSVNEQHVTMHKETVTKSPQTFSHRWIVRCRQMKRSAFVSFYLLVVVFILRLLGVTWCGRALGPAFRKAYNWPCPIYKGSSAFTSILGFWNRGYSSDTKNSPSLVEVWPKWGEFGKQTSNL